MCNPSLGISAGHYDRPIRTDLGGFWAGIFGQFTPHHLGIRDQHCGAFHKAAPKRVLSCSRGLLHAMCEFASSAMRFGHLLRFLYFAPSRSPRHFHLTSFRDWQPQARVLYIASSCVDALERPGGQPRNQTDSATLLI